MLTNPKNGLVYLPKFPSQWKLEDFGRFCRVASSIYRCVNSFTWLTLSTAMVMVVAIENQ